MNSVIEKPSITLTNKAITLVTKLNIYGAKFAVSLVPGAG